MDLIKNVIACNIYKNALIFVFKLYNIVLSQNIFNCHEYYIFDKI